MKVLDLDMDYFMETVETGITSGTVERIPEKEYGEKVWSENKVRTFLEQNLGLSKHHRLPGRIVTNHHESLFFWEELIAGGKLVTPFEVVHVDSHADLGCGYDSPDFLQSELLTLPIEISRGIRSI